jgi:hypothetical protein
MASRILAISAILRDTTIDTTFENAPLELAQERSARCTCRVAWLSKDGDLFPLRLNAIF